jgi:hypothetical protein
MAGISSGRRSLLRSLIQRAAAVARAAVPPILLAVGLILLVACAGDTPQATGEAKHALPEGYQMAVVKTATETPDPKQAEEPGLTPETLDSTAPAATSAATRTAPPATEQTQPGTADIVRISVEEAKAMADRGEAVFVDTRSPVTFEQAHITGAISMSSAEIAARYAELPVGKVAIFYCA